MVNAAIEYFKALFDHSCKFSLSQKQFQMKLFYKADQSLCCPGICLVTALFCYSPSEDPSAELACKPSHHLPFSHLFSQVVSFLCSVNLLLFAVLLNVIKALIPQYFLFPCH